MSATYSSRASRIAARFSEQFPETDPDAKEILARMVQLVHLFELDNAPLLERYGLNRAMFSALVALRLSYNPFELRHHELQDRVLITSGGLTNMCKRLESLGMIARKPDPDDKRGVIFELTEMGIEAANEIIPQQHRLEVNVLDHLSTDEKHTLRTLLESFSRHYDRD